MVVRGKTSHRSRPGQQVDGSDCLMNRCLFYRVKKSGGAGMLFSFPAPFWDCLSIHSFSLFSTLFSRRGSPLMPREGSGYRTPSPRLGPSAPPHLFTFLCPYLEISRSPPPVWSANTLTSSAQKESRANSLERWCSDPDRGLLVGSHVHSRAVRSCLGSDYVSCLPGCSAEGKRFFFPRRGKLAAVIVEAGMRHG